MSRAHPANRAENQVLVSTSLGSPPYMKAKAKLAWEDEFTRLTGPVRLISTLPFIQGRENKTESQHDYHTGYIYGVANIFCVSIEL